MAGSLADSARRLTAVGNRPLPAAWLVSDPARLPDPMPVLRRMPRGAGLIWRPYGLAWAEALARGRALRRRTRARGMVLLVAGDWRLAAVLGADGLHLPEGLARRSVLAPALAWAKRQGRLLSVACHGPRALARARALNADMAVLSPVFPTASHPDAATLGPVRFTLMSRRAGLPTVALGGITPATAPRLRHSGAAGLAAVSGWDHTVSG
ncbi:thiamine phosphate synthase [Rhodospira trueperi]|uniref:Thiamine-phosphate pyrophosphorylase n=1 Tax=Rhodospira trueperi TaxID=69960 RepID=A0A1G7AAN3_9PROT|nr:thiamine phosphate synthase [Rhodospira trueperi]SDE11998.1 thiamine-phosphate pyrophosphorylase [Rhodospira trueperi]